MPIRTPRVLLAPIFKIVIEESAENHDPNAPIDHAVDFDGHHELNLGHLVVVRQNNDDGDDGDDGEDHPDSEPSSPQIKSANILRRLRKQRVVFAELCVTNFHSLFSVIEPQSNYFAVRKWANNPRSFGFVCNVFEEFSRIPRSTRSTRLSPPGKRMFDTPNAGGSSLWSEVISYELLNGLYGATLVRTEMEILYGCHSKITDYSVRMFGHHFGVSVTRAMKYRGIFCEEDGFSLLRKKLNGVIKSTSGVIREHRWEKQILHVWAECDYVADVLRRAYMALEDEYKANTLVLCTVARDCDSLF
jgi:hypothetical protein